MFSDAALISFPGEFGSVMEGLLTQEESALRVAVKTMKSELTVQVLHNAAVQQANTGRFIRGSKTYVMGQKWQIFFI